MRNPTWRYIAEQLRPHRKMIAWLSVLAVLAAVIDTVIPVLYGRALDAAVARQPATVLAMFLGTWLVLRLVVDLFRRILDVRGRYLISLDIERAHTLYTFGHLLNLPLSFHHAQRGGEIQERVNQVRNSLTTFVGRGLFDLVPGMLTVVIATAYLTYIDVWLGAANLVVVAMFFWRSARLVQLLDAKWNAREVVNRKLYGRIWDAIRNVAIVKSNGAEAFERANAEELSEAVARVRNQSIVIDYRQAREQDIIFGVGTIALFAIATFRVSGGALTAGQLAMVLGYAFLTWSMVRQFLWTRWEYVALQVYIQRYREIADVPEEAYGVGEPHAIRGDVEFSGIRFRYREDTPVLEEVSFTVKAGQTVALVGESGQGKTTIMELLERFIEPQAGVITIDGKSVRDIELGNLRSQLAYVPQDLTLFHDTVRQNIRYGRLDASDAEVEAASRDAALHEWITTLPEGYDTVVGERGLKLSAGQRQRVAIARAFLRQPRILILDEPTSNLDAATEFTIHESLHRLMQGRTTFVIAHRLRTVQEADHIFVLQGGRIAERGTHAQLMRKRSGIYRKLRDMQFAELSGAEE